MQRDFTISLSFSDLALAVYSMGARHDTHDVPLYKITVAYQSDGVSTNSSSKASDGQSNAAIGPSVAFRISSNST